MAIKVKNKRSFTSYFTNNLGLKILSLVFAFILWSFVITATNQERTKTVSGITVNIEGLSALEALGYTTRDDFSESNLSVKVKVSTNRSDFKLVDKNFITASLDLSQLTKDGTSAVPVIVSFSNTADVSLVSVAPSSFTVTVDPIVSKDVPVVLEQTGTLKENLVSYSPVIPENITISGSSYYVERITKAIAEVNLSDLSDSEIISAQCRFTDEKDNAIKFTASRIRIDMDIQTVKDVRLSLDNTFINADKIADGFTFESAKTDTVKICGHATAIEKISELAVKEIDLQGKDDSFTSCTLTPILPEGVHLLPSSALPTATVQISPIKQSLTLKSPLIVSGLGNGLTAVIASGEDTQTVSDNIACGINVNVMLTANSSVIDNIVPSDIIVYLPCAGKTAGTYTITPTVSINSIYGQSISSQIISPTQLTVTIK